MTTWQIILIPISMVVIGLVRQLYVLRRKASQLDLACEFLNKFIEWCNSRTQDHALYDWMLRKSDAVQIMLGAGGLMHLRRPFENGYHTNIPIILNGIPDIQNEWRNQWRNDQTIHSYTQAIDGCLRRFIGSTEEQLGRERTRFFNPLVLFCGGVAWLMELPLLILSETKVITANRRAIIVGGKLFSLVSGLVALAAMVGTIVTLVTGWERFVQIITGWVA
jgi:hypothetical protein